MTVTILRFTILFLIIFVYQFSSVAQVFDGSIYVSTSDAKIIRIDSVQTHPTETIICSTQYNLWDIGFAPDNTLWGVYSGLLLKIEADGTSSKEFFLLRDYANSLSFDQNGLAYIGFSESSIVVTLDVTQTGGNVKTWHDFGSGYASGDFIFLKDKLYIAWMMGDDVHLYEVEVGSSNEYITHRDLGMLPDNTFGLASNGQNLIFGVTDLNQIYSFTPPQNYTTTIYISNLYTFLKGDQGYGATSRVESFGNTILDFGDAPAPFPTSNLDGSAACHIMIPGLCLGKNIDNEANGISSQAADGDDTNTATNDDDGVKIASSSFQNYTLMTGCYVDLTIEHQGKGYLSAWFDWNCDKIWSDEEMVISSFSMENGLYQYPMFVPVDATSGVTYCRFRFSSEYVSKSSGYAKDGEVEDYMITIVGGQEIDSLAISNGNSIACTGNILSIPIQSANFYGINSVKLTFNYDPALLEFHQTANINPAFKNTLITANDAIAGTITLSWESNIYISVTGAIPLFNLEFVPIKPGQTRLDIDKNISNSNSLICNSNSIPIRNNLGIITINESPTAYAEPSINICEKADLKLSGTVSGTQQILEYHWKLPDGELVAGDSITLNTISMADNGLYYFYCMDIAGCMDSTFSEVTVIPLAEISFADYDTMYFSIGHILQATEVYDFCTWNTGDNSPAIEVNTEGLYWVSVTLNGCENIDSVYMLEKDLILYVPNTFSPNDDGKNDVLKAIGSSNNIRSFTMTVFSRWGTKLFESNDITKGWDGKYQKQVCLPGMYTFIVSYEPKNLQAPASTKIIRGSVMLVR